MTSRKRTNSNAKDTAPPSKRPTLNGRKKTSSDVADAASTIFRKRKELEDLLDQQILFHSLTDLHTHIMGMGSADFWVIHIIEGFLRRRLAGSVAKNAKNDVKYYIQDICEASNIFPPVYTDDEQERIQWLCSGLEPRLFDSSKGSLASCFDQEEGKYFITNSKLIDLLDAESETYPQGNGPVRSLIRNWFEFLDNDGQYPSLNHIRGTYRGEFTPEFVRRFKMRDVIISQCPEVLAVLTNHVLNNYSKMGVLYVEFSMSVSDLLKNEMLQMVTTEVFESSFQNAKLKERKNKNKKSTTEANQEEMQDFEASFKQEQRDDDVLDQSPPEEFETEMVYSSPIETVKSSAQLLNSEVDGDWMSGEPKTLFPKFSEQIQNKSTIEVDQQETQPDPFSRVGSVSSWKKSNTLSRDNNNAIQRTPRKEKSVFEMNNVGRLPELRWRRFAIEYFDRHVSQQHRFLAAFNRTKYLEMRFPIWNADSAELEYKDIASHRDGMESFRKLVLNNQKIRDFTGEPTLMIALHELAKHLCSDDVIDQMFFARKISSSSLEKMKGFTKEFKSSEELSSNVVGIDWVGDELCFPFCAFGHPDFIAQIHACRQINPHFGVRIHAGEGLFRHSTLQDDLLNGTDEEKYPVTAKIFMLHVFILIESIKSIYTQLDKMNESISASDVKQPVRMRIGHGIAFLFDYQKYLSDTPAELSEKKTYFSDQLDEFRQFLRTNDIPCELNPTSNHMLVQSGFNHGRSPSNERTLTAFLACELPVVLCTDDEGIWSIGLCKRHKRHMNVACELCNAIDRDEIQDKNTLKALLGRKYAFIEKSQRR